MNVKKLVTSRFWHIAGRASILSILLALTLVSALPLTSLAQGGGWLQQAKLMASDGADGDYFGASVAVDGNVAIVGARGNNKSDDEYGFDSGAAYYADADVNKVDEQTLTLDYWDGSRWVDAATTCTPVVAYERHPAENWLAVPICHLSEFALLGQRVHRVYLPLIVRN